MTRAGLRCAVDIGGTFTDLVIELDGAGLGVYKTPSTPDDPVIGLLEVVRLAAMDMGVAARELLGEVELFVHGTTRATNAIVTGTTARTALLCTKGHPDTLLWREGNDRRPPLDYSQEYPRPYIPRSLTFEVEERILSDGRVATPLNEAQLIEMLDAVRVAEVEAIAVCFLWSIVNPDHELQAGAAIEATLPGVPYTLSHSLSPSIREFRRASSAAIDASLKPLMLVYLQRLEEQLRAEGFGGRLLILTATGGALDAADVARAPIHSIGSGPAAAPISGRHYAELDLGQTTAIVTDAGGTTFDVSLIRRGQIPWTRETMVGDFPGYRTGFPSVDVRSVGSAGGSIAWVDEGGLLRVGPQSAGAVPGPAAYGQGGTRPTVTDACVLLGYIDPKYFLGGKIALRRDLAEHAVMTDVGGRLGLSPADAAAAIWSVAVEQMVNGIESITLNQGVDAREAVLVGGGGGAGLYSVEIARRLGVHRIVIPKVAAALSACGAVFSDLRSSYARVAPMSTSQFDYDRAAHVVRSLASECADYVARAEGEHAVGSSVTFSVEARYPDQVWEIEVPLRGEGIQTADELRTFLADFHNMHEELFAHHDAASPVEVVMWRAEVRCQLRAVTLTVPSSPQSMSARASRPAYFGRQVAEAPAYNWDDLPVGVPVHGPALIESANESVVLPGGATALRNESDSLVVDPGTRQDYAETDTSEAAVAAIG